MLSTVATAALINFLILRITYHESEPEYIKNKIENYDYYTISQSGSLFYSVTNQIIESAKNLDSNLTFIGRANIGLESVESSNGENKLSSLENYLYSISIQTIESSKVEFFYNDEAAQVIKDNKLISLNSIPLKEEIDNLNVPLGGLYVDDVGSLISLSFDLLADMVLCSFVALLFFKYVALLLKDERTSNRRLKPLYPNFEDVISEF